MLLLAVLAAAQVSDVAVVVSSGRDRSNTIAPELARRMRAALEKAGVQVLSEAETTRRLGTKVDPRGCDGATQCLRGVAYAMEGRPVVVGVDAAKVAGLVGAHFDAVPPGGAPLISGDFAGDEKKWKTTVDAQLLEFAQGLHRVLPPPAPPEPPPEAARPPPPPKAPEPVAAAEPPKPAPAKPPPAPEPGSHTLVAQNDVEPPQPEPLAPQATAAMAPSRGAPVVPILLCAGAVGSAATAIIFAVLGLKDAGEYQRDIVVRNGMNVSLVPRSELDRLTASMNRNYTIALIAGIAAGVLAIASLVLFLKD